MWQKIYGLSVLAMGIFLSGRVLYMHPSHFRIVKANADLANTYIEYHGMRFGHEDISRSPVRKRPDLQRNLLRNGIREKVCG